MTLIPMTTVRLPRTLVNQLLHHAQGSPEREVCGLIGTRDGEPANSYPVKNISSRPGRLFHMDPKGQIDAMRTMRERGESLFAIYHSHPHTPAAPSAQDVAQDEYPDALYLVISLDTKGVLEMRGFKLGGETVEAVELEVE
jgi:proteasome lid subunit RPN8/RPN11